MCFHSRVNRHQYAVKGAGYSGGEDLSLQQGWHGWTVFIKFLGLYLMCALAGDVDRSWGLETGFLLQGFALEAITPHEKPGFFGLRGVRNRVSLPKVGETGFLSRS